MSDQSFNADEAWARALTPALLVDHVKAVASDVRRFAPEQRTALLNEIARRFGNGESNG